MNRGELKANAKKSLKGNLGTAIGVTVVFGALTSIPSMIPQLFNSSSYSDMTKSLITLACGVLSIIVASFLTVGAISYFLKLSRNEEVEFGELFSKTNLWMTCLVAIVMMGIFTSLWTLLLIIPGIIASYRYRMTPYIIADDPKVGGLEAITRSKEMMKGHKMDLFVLELSFFGWNLLAICTFGLLYFWLAPYMSVTYANFYNSLAGKKAKSAKK